MAQTTSSRPVYRIGGTVIPKDGGSPNLAPRLQTPKNGEMNDSDPSSGPASVELLSISTPQAQHGPPGRTIRFPDEPLTTPQAEVKEHSAAN